MCPPNVKTFIRTPLFFAALFPVAQTGRQLKGPSREDWVKKARRIGTMGCCSATRKDETLPFETLWMDPRMSC